MGIGVLACAGAPAGDLTTKVALHELRVSDVDDFTVVGGRTSFGR